MGQAHPMAPGRQHLLWADIPAQIHSQSLPRLQESLLPFKLSVMMPRGVSSPVSQRSSGRLGNGSPKSHSWVWMQAVCTIPVPGTDVDNLVITPCLSQANSVSYRVRSCFRRRCPRPTGLCGEHPNVSQSFSTDVCGCQSVCCVSDSALGHGSTCPASSQSSLTHRRRSVLCKHRAAGRMGEEGCG